MKYLAWNAPAEGTHQSFAAHVEAEWADKPLTHHVALCVRTDE